MRKADFNEFHMLMEQALDLTVMPNGKEPERVITALFTSLAPYPLELIRDAVIAHCRTEKFFPMLADIVRRIEGSAEEKATVAWAMVRNAIRRYTAYSVKFPSPAIHYAIMQMGGWLKLCYMDSRELDFRERNFALLFNIGEKKASWDGANGTYKVPAYFLGECDAHNVMCGYDKQVPVEIIDVYSEKKINTTRALEASGIKKAINSPQEKIIKQLTKDIKII